MCTCEAETEMRTKGEHLLIIHMVLFFLKTVWKIPIWIHSSMSIKVLTWKTSLLFDATLWVTLKLFVNCQSFPTGLPGLSSSSLQYAWIPFILLL